MPIALEDPYVDAVMERPCSECSRRGSLSCEDCPAPERPYWEQGKIRRRGSDLPNIARELKRANAVMRERSACFVCGLPREGLRGVKSCPTVHYFTDDGGIGESTDGTPVSAAEAGLCECVVIHVFKQVGYHIEPDLAHPYEGAVLIEVIPAADGGIVGLRVHPAGKTDFEVTLSPADFTDEHWLRGVESCEPPTGYFKLTDGVARTEEECGRALRAIEVAQTYSFEDVGMQSFQVTHPEEFERSYTVELIERRCSCPDWSCTVGPQGLSCKHLLAVDLRTKGKLT